MSTDDELAANLLRILNSHGYAFQQAVIRHCHLLAHSGSAWEFVEAQVPFELNGREGHIDFVLRHRTSGAVMVVECKRADPATARWCFARTNSPESDDANPAQPVISTLLVDHSVNRAEERPAVWTGRDAYQLVVQLKTGATGSGRGQDKSDSEVAITQAFRGTSGLLQQLADSRAHLTVAAIPVVPVVFTTAQLFATETVLAEADLSTGPTRG
jgi:hypothetical protein